MIGYVVEHVRHGHHHGRVGGCLNFILLLLVIVLLLLLRLLETREADGGFNDSCWFWLSLAPLQGRSYMVAGGGRDPPRLLPPYGRGDSLGLE